MRLRSRHAPQKILPLICLHSLGGTTEAVGSIPMGRAICRGGGYVCVPLSDEHIFRSIEVSIPACHAGDPGSIPGGRELFAVGYVPLTAMGLCPAPPWSLVAKPWSLVTRRALWYPWSDKISAAGV